MTDAAYHAAFHAMLMEACIDSPTGAGLVRFIVEFGRRGTAEFEVAARALFDIYGCDGSAWSVDEFIGWLEPTEGISYSVARQYAEAIDG